jgi:hypothetical protein
MNNASRQLHHSSKSWSASEPKSHRGVKLGNRSREFLLTFLLPLSQVIARRDTKICRTCRRSFVALTELVPKKRRLLKTPKPRLVSSKSANILSSLQDGSDGGALIFFGFVLCLSLSWRVFLRTGRHPGRWSKSPKLPRRTDDFMCVWEKRG